MYHSLTHIKYQGLTSKWKSSRKPFLSPIQSPDVRNTAVVTTQKISWWITHRIKTVVGVVPTKPSTPSNGFSSGWTNFASSVEHTPRTFCLNCFFANSLAIRDHQIWKGKSIPLRDLIMCMSIDASLGLSTIAVRRVYAVVP